MRWLWWFVLAPQVYLVGGLWQDLGLPPIDVSAVLCLYLAWFARRSALPLLLVGCAIGRAVLDQAALPVQLLVLGVPVAVLLPLRSLFVAQHWLWQAFAAALLTIGLAELAGLCGYLFDEPSSSAKVHGWQVVWTAAGMPPCLWLLRRLPPFASFCERESLLGGGR